jgi:subtilisin family serine protease
MRTRRLAELALLTALVAVALIIGTAREPGHAAEPAPAVSWQGLAGGGPRADVGLGQQMIVLLKIPSLADRVAAHGGIASDKQERTWTASNLSQQRLLLARLQVQGADIRPEFSFARVVSGFSATLDPASVALLERDDAVQGVYPVRVAYPASISATAFDKSSLTSSLGNAQLQMPGFDGRGVTVALLDTGVDRLHPSLLGSVAPGIDIVSPDGDATAKTAPGGSELERHGTELAGIIAADRGPLATNGVAVGASVLPIRVAGWQPDGHGGYAVYARTDQVIQGLERAVDPSGDGDAHDAARIALIGVAAPFAAFDDDPAARAVAGASRLDTLVVAPAGNDGPAGPGFGSVAGPGGAPSALTVGAADVRASVQTVHVSIRAGIDVLLDRDLPLSGAFGAEHPFTAPVTAPALVRTRASFADVMSYFAPNGLSLVAGRATLVHSGASPAVIARSASGAGATAVLLYGELLPAGGIPLDEATSVPVVGIPTGAALEILRALAAHHNVSVSFGTARAKSNDATASVAPFSSTGLAFDGRVKPDVVAPGVAVATTEPGLTDEGEARYGTVHGSSASAAAVAGAAALLAQARPALSAAALRSVLVNSALQLPDVDVTTQGAGLVAIGAAAAAEVAAEPATLAFGNARGRRWQAEQSIVVRNVSSRPLHMHVRIARDSEGAAPVAFRSTPSLFVLGAGRTQVVRVRASVSVAALGAAPASGSVVLAPRGGSPARVPWAITFAQAPDALLGPLTLSTTSFTPSDVAPSLLTFQAGRILADGARVAVQPLAVLRLDLYSSDGTNLGTLARLHDLLPGRYAFGITGRSPAGNVLGRGTYRLRVSARPVLAGPVSVASVRFTIK